MNQQFQDYIVQVLKEAQDDGYVTPENDDNEVGQWIGAVSYQIAQKADQLLEPERYFKYGGYYYRVKDLNNIQKLSLND